MAEIAHASVAQTTRQTATSSTFADVSGASLASGNFTAGKKYLLLVMAQLDGGTATNIGFQVRHGTTTFGGSGMRIKPTSATARYPYFWFTVWTAVASEAVTCQLRSQDNSTTVGCDQVVIVAINLSDNVVEDTDWFFATNDSDALALTTTYQDGTTITFTPATGGHQWLVLTYAQFDIGSTTESVQMRLDRSGEASSSVPEAIWEGEDTIDLIVMTLARVFTLAAQSQTFKNQSAASANSTGHQRFNDKVFALDLNKFQTVAAAYTEGGTTLSTTDWATALQTLSITPTIAGDVLVLGHWMLDVVSAETESAQSRLQVDDADQPDTQTSDAYFQALAYDVRDRYPISHLALVTVTAAAHTVDLDASGSDGTESGQNRTLVAFTMDLAVVSPGGFQHIGQGMGDPGIGGVPQTLHTIEQGISA